jgi:hypothetical protein
MLRGDDKWCTMAVELKGLGFRALFIIVGAGVSIATTQASDGRAVSWKELVRKGCTFAEQRLLQRQQASLLDIEEILDDERSTAQQRRCVGQARPQSLTRQIPQDDTIMLGNEWHCETSILRVTFSGSTKLMRWIDECGQANSLDAGVWLLRNDTSGF